ncbi:MAG: ComEC/Rec2 family competence protein [Alphaproteobacteria bacterium]
MFFKFFDNFIDNIIANYEQEKANKVLWLIVIFASGIGFYFSLSNEPPQWLGLVFLELFIFLAVIFRLRPYILTIIMALGIFTFGFFVAQIKTITVKAPVLNKSGIYFLTGRVLKIEEGAGKRGQRVVLDSLEISKVKEDSKPQKIRIVLTPKSDKVLYGDVISVKANLNRPFLPSITGASNFARLAWFEQIGAVGYAVSKVDIISRDDRIFSKLKFAVGNLRIKMSGRIDKVLPNEKEGSIAKALISGERGEIPRFLIDAYRDSGLAHFLSISGLHMGLVGGFTFFLVRFLLAFFPFIALRYDIKKLAAVLAIFTTTCYLIVSGFRIPAERAYIMTTIVFIAVLVNRRAISMRLVGFAGALILLIYPESLVSPSFQMSFAAVIALIAVYESFNPKLLRPKFNKEDSKTSLFFKKIFFYLTGVVMADFVASLATLPFAVYHFNRIAVYTLLCNLLAAPIIGFIVMPCVVFTLLMMPFGLEYPALKIGGLGIKAINHIVLWVSSLPHSVLLVKAMPVGSLVLITIGLLWVCLWQLKWRYYGLLLVMIGALCHSITKIPDVIVGENGKLAAVKLDDGTIALSSSKTSFVSKVWLDRAGLSVAEVKGNHKFWLPENRESTPNLRCDSYGCVYRKNGKQIAVLQKIDDVKKDCDNADLVISPFSLNKICKGKKYIDFWNFYKNGTYSLTITDDGKIRIKNVKESIGNRYWSGKS